MGSVPQDVKKAIREKFAWPGGYPLFLLCSDGEALCTDCGKSEFKQIAYSCRHNLSDRWKVEVAHINWEDQDLFCAHCNKQIEPSYSPN